MSPGGAAPKHRRKQDLRAIRATSDRAVERFRCPGIREPFYAIGSFRIFSKLVVRELMMRGLDPVTPSP